MDSRAALALIALEFGVSAATVADQIIEDHPIGPVSGYLSGAPRSKPDDGHEEEHSTSSVRLAQTRAGGGSGGATGMIKPQGIASAEVFGTPTVSLSGLDTAAQLTAMYREAGPELRATILAALGVPGAQGPQEPYAGMPLPGTGSAIHVQFPKVSPLNPFKKA